jgi:deazaflavin-dependent oxidoreductase (nitroreductase family)
MWTRIGNRIAVWLFRALGGRLPSPVANVRVLLLTTPGRVTGRPRSTCVGYLEVPAGLLVWGTAGGARRDPDWFRNLRTAPVATVQIRGEHLQLRPRELEGEERAAMWAHILELVPSLRRYEGRANRAIPVALLERP